jgi:hypothetical protein
LRHEIPQQGAFFPSDLSGTNSEEDFRIPSLQSAPESAPGPVSDSPSAATPATDTQATWRS